ncbi:hypothetical protein H632_c140p2 [Helicosporidium sp. ATCC 50920]|nr:hypothetical protein H632_c140p2 [Helicosporidium sp. ATCC 50920]|eukprot:KDD76681.1 hypothetical protein H632_c140p2 [Helicosporidium sp. ATCC 50920]
MLRAARAAFAASARLSSGRAPLQCSSVLTQHYHASDDKMQTILEHNKRWSEEKKDSDPSFFYKLSNIQAPEWLWIGCSDSRVPANQLMGLGPGEVFVQRNVGNIVTHHDMNVMSCIEYAVSVLKVRHIIVCGHHNCGAVKAALEMPHTTPSLVNLWIQDIRDTRDRNLEQLRKLEGQAQVNRLAEFNVMRQVFSVCTCPVVQAAWAAEQPLSVHGVIYALEDGRLREVTQPITGLDDLERYAEHKRGVMKHLSGALLTRLQFERQLKRLQTEPDDGAEEAEMGSLIGASTNPLPGPPGEMSP